MTQGLAKYHARAPRYILFTDEDNLIRVAGPRQIPWEEGTEIQNVSLTGLAFTAPYDLCPILGEIIKIQFSLPSEKQMASYALVTRIDKHTNNNNLVAVHFYKMEMGHRIALAQGLSKKFREHHSRPTESSSTSSQNSSSLTLNAFPKMLTFTLFASFWLYSFYLFLFFQKLGGELMKKILL